MRHSSQPVDDGWTERISPKCVQIVAIFRKRCNRESISKPPVLGYFFSMKKFTLALAIWLLALAPSAFAHDTPSNVQVKLESASQLRAGEVHLDFDLISVKTGALLKQSDLEVTNEKILHCFIYDAALKEFHHEHPTFDGALWHVSSNVTVNGNYFVFLQGRTAADHEDFVLDAEVAVSGGAPANPAPPVLGDHRSAADEISVATLSNDKIIAGNTTMLWLNFSRTDGTPAVITPYLGVLAHVTIVSNDGDRLIHVHPMTGSSNTNLMLHTEFPEAGDYRIWIEFIDGGALRTVPLSVSVIAHAL